MVLEFKPQREETKGDSKGEGRRSRLGDGVWVGISTRLGNGVWIGIKIQDEEWR